MRGRKKKPTALRVVEGSFNQKTPKAQRAAALAIEPPPGLPDPPDGMSDGARAKYMSVGATVLALRVMTPADAEALAVLANTLADIDALRHRLVDLGGTAYEIIAKSGDTMRRAHPEYAQLADAERRAVALLAHFGLTPSARAKVSQSGEAPIAKPDRYFA